MNTFDAASFPCVYVIVLNWNNYDDSKACLESLRKATYPNMKVVIVDNGSMDESGTRLKNEFPEHLFVANDENLGFSRGCNTGIRESLNHEDCAYVLLLNNDAEVTPGFLEPGVNCAEQDQQVGAVSGKILQEGSMIWYAGGHIDHFRGQAVVRGKREIDKGQYDTVEETKFVTGALMLIRRKALEDVGPLCEEYFFGIEEWDYSVTLRKAGYKLLYVPGFSVFHRANGTHENWGGKYIYNGYRNKLIFQQRFLPKPLFLIWKACYWFHLKWRGERAREKLVARDPVLTASPPHEEFMFALEHAYEDHNRVYLDEAALDRFDASFNEWRTKTENRMPSSKVPT